jgi:hypothetical protein
MTSEMNQLHELLFGQNEMIEGCLDEMQDEHRDAQLYQLTSRLAEGVSKNILQRNLFIILESLEMIAQLQLCPIFFLIIIVPMYWRASNIFKLAHHHWREKSMGRVIDLVYHAFVAIQADGLLILDYNFMMEIFVDLQRELPEFNTNMTWYFEEKECNPIY